MASITEWLPVLDNLVSNALLNPGYFMQKFDFAAGKSVFYPMTRADFSSSTFLDERIDSFGQPQQLNLDKLLMDWKTLPRTGRKAGYIFHTAYCCSTLLSRAVDRINQTMVYREPPVLHQLAVLQRRRGEVPAALMERWDEFLDLAMGMLTKCFSDTEVPVIKATDSCNNIIERLLSHRHGDSALLLYSQLEDFMVSNLKSEGRRKFLRNFLVRAQRDLGQFPEISVAGQDKLDDARAAALVWMVQIASYRRVLVTCGSVCKTLDANNLLESPQECLQAVSAHLGLQFSDSDIVSVINSPAWSRHAKDRSRDTYSRDARVREKAALRAVLDTEIREGVDWVRSFPGWSEQVDFSEELV